MNALSTSPTARRTPQAPLPEPIPESPTAQVLAIRQPSAHPQRHPTQGIHQRHPRIRAAIQAMC
jgi:hypothetical protein